MGNPGKKRGKKNDNGELKFASRLCKGQGGCMTQEKGKDSGPASTKAAKPEDYE